MHDRLSEQIATLPSLKKAQLLDIWAKNFSKDQPPKLRKELIIPILAYRIREAPMGKLALNVLLSFCTFHFVSFSVLPFRL
jgi:hypothetical protein